MTLDYLDDDPDWGRAVFCSGGAQTLVGRLAGCDARFEPHTVYPGVLQFLKELDIGAFGEMARSGEIDPAIGPVPLKGRCM